MHGRLSPIHHDGSALFAGIPQGFRAVRYHSLAVGAVPAALRVTAWTPDGVIMGARAPRRGRCSACSSIPSRSAREHGRAAARELPRPHPRRRVPRGARARRRRAAAGRRRRPRRALHRRRLEHWCEPEAVFGALYAEREHAVWLDSARAGRASRASRSSARPTGHSVRSCATTSRRARVMVERASGARSATRACSTIVAASSRACARTRPSCRSTSSAASPGTSATSSRPSAAARRVRLDAAGRGAGALRPADRLRPPRAPRRPPRARRHRRPDGAEAWLAATARRLDAHRARAPAARPRLRRRRARCGSSCAKRPRRT